MEYLVKWKKYDLGECSWVKEADMHCSKLLKHFEKGEKYENEDCKWFP